MIERQSAFNPDNRLRLLRVALILLAALVVGYGAAADENADAGFVKARIEANTKAYQIGMQNFSQIITQIKNRYENADIDLRKILAYGLYGAGKVVQKVEGASAEIALATNAPPYELEELEYAKQIGDMIAGRIRADRIASATVASITQMWNATLTSMVNALDDPYSQYLPPKNYDDLQHFLSGEGNPDDVFYGVGISIDWDYANNQGIYVLYPLPDSPSFHAGIEPGDVIVAVNNVPLCATGTARENLDAGVKRIKGREGTKVKLTIIRPGVGPFPLHFELARKPVQPYQLIWRDMLDEDTGKIVLVSFYQKCSVDVEKALLALRQQGMKKLILDLRGDPGGFLDEAVKVADLFLAKDSLITYTQGRTADTRKDFYDKTTGDENYTQLPIVILVDGQSASASEVVTGALRDSDRGDVQVVGMTTFGKGSVQELFELAGEAGLRLTVAKYYTPKGRCIHNQGIEPDVKVEKVDLSQQDLTDNEDKNDEEPKRHIFHSRLEKQLFVDNQLKAAYELLNPDTISEKPSD